MIKIPFSDQNDFIIEAELDGVTWFLHLAWNDDAQIWTLSLENAQNNAVLSGIGIVPDVPLLRRFAHLSVPAGELVAVVSNGGKTLGRDDFYSGRAELVYVPVQAA